MPYLIGVDVGSSDCKAIIVDDRGEIVARDTVSYNTHRSQIGWAEQNPEDWYRTACQTIRSCLQTINADPRDVIGIAIDGPAHNVALMDNTGQIIYPTIHWSDLRSVAQSQRLEANYGDQIFQLTYCRVNPSWTLTQLLWLKENEPQIWSKLRKILVTKDYVRFRFTGEYQTDPYDAIGTQLYDVTTNEWSNTVCAIIDFDPARLPPVASPGSISGGLLPEAARDSGLAPGIPVAVGSGDSVVEALGIGATQPGHCIIKLGTAANVNLVTDQPYPSREAITYRHLVEPRWFIITATNSGAATMRWFRERFCRSETQQAAQEGANVHELIDRLARDANPGSRGLLFHPYLMGERSPYWDPQLRGDFIGIQAQHNLHHFARAVLEGVAYSIRDCLQSVRELGQPIKQYSIIGGGAKSQLWRQIICDTLGVPLIKPFVEDAAFGAALVAGVAIGVFESWEHAAKTCARVQEVLQPDYETHHLYSEYFAVYRALVAELAPFSHRLAQLANC